MCGHCSEYRKKQYSHIYHFNSPKRERGVVHWEGEGATYLAPTPIKDFLIWRSQSASAGSDGQEVSQEAGLGEYDGRVQPSEIAAGLSSRNFRGSGKADFGENTAHSARDSHLTGRHRAAGVPAWAPFIRPRQEVSESAAGKGYTALAAQERGHGRAQKEYAKLSREGGSSAGHLLRTLQDEVRGGALA